jgi:diaminopimelate epimerase
MRFTKMHGAGNDYVYVDGQAERLPQAPAELALLAKVISDRHRGVGADGLILILPSTVADLRMRMFNADGSEAEMCGNGIRCVAKYAWDHGLAKRNPVRIETGSGVLTLKLEITGDLVQRVTVDMGQPILEAGKIPTTLAPPAERVVDLPLPADLDAKWLAAGATVGQPNWIKQCGLICDPGSGRPLVTCVSMGNPHAIFYCADAAKIPLLAVGPLMEAASVFPRRVNVHFVQVAAADQVIMRTWERGSGITQACGTGACAVAVAGVLTGRSHPRVIAKLPGGDLELDWQMDATGAGSVLMTGPAVEIFSGDWPIDVR